MLRFEFGKFTGRSRAVKGGEGVVANVELQQNIPVVQPEPEKKSDLESLVPIPFSTEIPTEIVGKSTTRALECIALNTTTKEILSGRFETFMNRLLECTVPTDTTRSITLYIILNNTLRIDVAKEWIPKLAHVFKSVDVISLDIAAIDDLYVMNPRKDETCGKYGFISGPYVMFSKTMYLCQRYNTTLLIETDCFLSENWVEKIYNYTKYVGGFWISGATYDGRTNFWGNRIMFEHINGVALYATSNIDFISFLKKFEEYFVFIVTQNKFWGYDFAIRAMVNYFLEDANCSYYWRIVNRNIITTQFIINSSSSVDNVSMEKEIKSAYDYAILHKK
jgi:hypothetical protein